MGGYIYTIDKIKELLKDSPYTIDESTFTYLRKGFTAYTKDGYKVIINNNYFRNHGKPEIFHKCNPYTIYNIKNYIKLNNIDIELISEKYNGNSIKMQWKCKCGCLFERSWKNVYNGSILCSKCSSLISSSKRRTSIEEIESFLMKSGLFLMNKKKDNITNARIEAYDKEGYKYDFLWYDFQQGKKPSRFHTSNKYTIENINNFLKLSRNGEYECIQQKYNGNDKIMKFRHLLCGTIFNATLVDFQGKSVKCKKIKYVKKCPICKTTKTESIHASILKQVFIHEFPNTILEDKSCINPKTNRPLPTDIVNHELKIAIEIQSAYHDKEIQAIKDKIKKDFWLSNGYTFYAPDIRNYTIIELIKIFFPNINNIPDYIDYNFSDCINFNKVQELIDSGYSIKEISKILNKPHGSIYSLCYNEKVTLPNNYKEKILHRKPIVRLSKNGDFIKRYESASAIKCDNFATGTVNRVLKGKQKYSYDSIWLYEEDYINGTYSFPDDKYLVPIEKYDMYDNFIKSYNSIYDAEKDSVSNKSEIYRVATGEHKSSRKEKWKFKIA